MNKENEIQESRTDLLEQHIYKTKVLHGIILERRIAIEGIVDTNGFSQKREKLNKLLREDEETTREEVRAKELAGRLYHLMMSEEPPEYVYKKIDKKQLIVRIDPLMGTKKLDPIQARITVVPSETEQERLVIATIRAEHEWNRKKFESAQDFFKENEELWWKIKYQRLEILQLDRCLRNKTRYFIERIRKLFLRYSYC